MYLNWHSAHCFAKLSCNPKNTGRSSGRKTCFFNLDPRAKHASALLYSHTAKTWSHVLRMSRDNAGTGTDTFCYTYCIQCIGTGTDYGSWLGPYILFRTPHLKTAHKGCTRHRYRYCSAKYLISREARYRIFVRIFHFTGTGTLQCQVIWNKKEPSVKYSVIFRT
jgi:hypothetical protein